ncbi:DNA-binding MarR family transcriptional regulator [Mycetocola sp. BIGb0189]|uniref:MarR family winged helix-turn-helix transcriptional regulator n=1 Tax=Mycetocola sp. BIGb0189 TaxID=2940604 RepID=UPI002169133A|nr:MarR family winged helix-turn-helix transcriptional regulator [Mycetocola sp. BIGb0189]MCS4275248.1 DNA-binding MarR family transcriptional regulator [Mycetocola sp. BIGb0189]
MDANSGTNVTPEISSGGTCNSYLVRRVDRHLNAVYDRALAGTGIRTTQFSVLRALALEGESRISTLAATLGMDRSTLSANVKPLVRAGLIEVTEASDRRARDVRITEAGRTTLEGAMPAWIAVQESFESAMGHESARALRKLLAGTLTWDGA